MGIGLQRTISSTLKDIEIEIIYGTFYDNLWMPGEILDAWCNKLYKFQTGFRHLLVSLGVHQPPHKVLSTSRIQILAVVTGESSLWMALIFIYLIWIIEWVCLGSWEWTAKNNDWGTEFYKETYRKYLLWKIQDYLILEEDIFMT